MARTEPASVAVKLTKRLVDRLAPSPDGDFYVWDAQLKGFGVRTWPSGTRTFVLYYRPHGSRRKQYLTLGTYGDVTVDQARVLAKRHLGAIAGGDDPAAKRRASRVAATVRELGETYLADVDARAKPATAKAYRRLWARHVLPALGTEQVAKVAPAAVSKLHRKLSDTPTTANRVAAILGAFFSFAGRQGVRPAHDNPTRGLPRYREHSRERFLTAEEFGRLGDAILTAERTGLLQPDDRRERTKNDAKQKHRPKIADTPMPADPYAIGALRLLLLTGARLGEVLTLKWSEVDQEAGALRLADTKSGRSTRPLSAPALAVLAALPREAGSPYVFPGRSAGSHLTTIQRLWDSVRLKSGLGDLRIHDLRHSYASASAFGGNSLFVIGKLLGHRNVATTARYSHLADDPLKAAAEATASTLQAWLEGRKTPVTPIRKVGA